MFLVTIVLIMTHSERAIVRELIIQVIKAIRLPYNFTLSFLLLISSYFSYNVKLTSLIRHATSLTVRRRSKYALVSPLHPSCGVLGARLVRANTRSQGLLPRGLILSIPSAGGCARR